MKNLEQKAISGAINLGIGALGGYLAHKDMTATTPPTTFFGKKANMLAIGAAVVGLGGGMIVNGYDKYLDPVAASGLTLLGRAIYLQYAVTNPTPGISEFPASMTMVPHARGAARNYMPGFDNVEMQ